MYSDFLRSLFSVDSNSNLPLSPSVSSPLSSPGSSSREETRTKLRAFLARPIEHDLRATKTIDPEEAKKIRQTDFEQCEKLKEEAILRHRPAKFLLRALARLGCKVDPWRFINCVPCDVQVSGALQSKQDDTLEIVMCQNFIGAQDEWNRVLTHELTHAYDMCRAEFDPTNCEHHACTEIRAARLSGDCGAVQELRRGGLVPGGNKLCVQRRAALSIKVNPHCKGREKAAVDAVFERCYNDLAPFGAVP